MPHHSAPAKAAASIRVTRSRSLLAKAATRKKVSRSALHAARNRYFAGTEFKGRTKSAIHQTIKKYIQDQFKAKPVGASVQVCNLAQNAAGQGSDYIHFEKDALGRTVFAVGRIIGNQGRPKGTIPAVPGIDSRIDDRGHLVPEAGVTDAALHKVNSLDNLVAENRLINQHFKKAFEDQVIAYAAANPTQKIHTIHAVEYSGTSTRPTKISHYFSIDGVVQPGLTFENPTFTIQL